MAEYQVRTVTGYDFFEVASAFQKSIRRGDEDQTMFWAAELWKSNYHKYLWKRMLVIMSEDIGLAEPALPAQIMALKQSYDYFIKEKDRGNGILPTLHALLLIIRARKSRFVDLAYSVYWNRHRKVKLQIPDYAFDMHTRRGKKMGRGLDHFYTEGAKINNQSLAEREAEFLKEAWDSDIETGNNPNIDTEGNTDEPKLFE